MDEFNGFYNVPVVRKLREVSYSPPTSAGMVHFGIDERTGKGFVSTYAPGFDDSIKVEIPIWLVEVILEAVVQAGKVINRN